MSLGDEKVRSSGSQRSSRSSQGSKPKSTMLNLRALGVEPKALMASNPRREAMVMIPELPDATSKFEEKIDEAFQNPRSATKILESNILVKEIKATQKEFPIQKIIDIVEERLRYNLATRLTLNLDADDEVNARFLEERWNDYYNLIIPLLSIPLNSNDVNMRQGFFRIFTEELFLNLSIREKFKDLLQISPRLQNMVVILYMNAIDSSLSKEGKAKLIEYYRTVQVLHYYS